AAFDVNRECRNDNHHSGLQLVKTGKTDIATWFNILVDHPGDLLAFGHALSPRLSMSWAQCINQRSRCCRCCFRSRLRWSSSSWFSWDSGSQTPNTVEAFSLAIG